MRDEVITMFGTALFPKPTDNWPTWAVWLYYAVVVAISLFMVIKIFMNSFAKVQQGHAGMRMRFERPIRRNPLGKDEVCEICTPRRNSSCEACRSGAYCTTHQECPVHDELKIVGPGFHWQIPFTHSMREISVQHDPINLPCTPFEYGEPKRKMMVDGAMSYQVRSGSRAMFQALFASNAPGTSIAELAKSALGMACTICGPDNARAIAEQAVALFDESAEPYGVSAVWYTVNPVFRSESQVIADGIGKSPTPATAVVGTRHLGLAQGE